VAKTKEEKQQGTELPGLSLEQFRAAVDAMAKLIRSGKYLAFLSQPHWIRLIGDLEAFAESFGGQLSKGKIETKDAQRALHEVRNFLQVALAISNSDRRVEFLQDHIFANEFKNLSKPDASRFRTLLADKANYVIQQEFASGAARRLARLETAVGPCLQEVDVELITKRQDRVEDEAIEQPFLRLRFRYSAQTDNAFPFFMGGAGPWGPGSPWVPTKSFELECDETDIDLLIQRLTSAKELLLQATGPTAKSEPGE
jgi:hypothetical protein